MELTKRTYPTTLIVIAALHLGLFLLVAVKPEMPAHGDVSYMDLLPTLQVKPKATPPAPSGARQTPAQTVAARRPRARPADVPAIADATKNADTAPPEMTLESAAPDFAVTAKPIDIDQLRKQAAKNDTDFKTPLDKVREQERRHRSIETVVAAGAKAGARKDCQTGYAGLGVLAIFPLIYGTVTDNGCKWK